MTSENNNNISEHDTTVEASDMKRNNFNHSNIKLFE